MAVPSDDYVNVSCPLVCLGIRPHIFLKLSPSLPVKAETSATFATMAHGSPGFYNFHPLFINGSLLHPHLTMLCWPCHVFPLPILAAHPTAARLGYGVLALLSSTFVAVYLAVNLADILAENVHCIFFDGDDLRDNQHAICRQPSGGPENKSSVQVIYIAAGPRQTT